MWWRLGWCWWWWRRRWWGLVGVCYFFLFFLYMQTQMNVTNLPARHMDDLSPSLHCNKEPSIQTPLSLLHPGTHFVYGRYCSWKHGATETAELSFVGTTCQHPRLASILGDPIHTALLYKSVGAGGSSSGEGVSQPKRSGFEAW